MKKLFILIVALISAGCIPDDYDVDMVTVEGGEFLMGSEDEDADDDEKPLHVVEIKTFRIGRYEITQKLWNLVMRNKNPSVFQGDDLPVECVSWYDVQIFINRLNKKTGRYYRLPTEAEWEYAAKGGNRSLNQTFSGGELKSTGWFIDNSDNTTHEVGTLEPNELGIYDMSGNVHEWCSDVYDSLSYSGSHNEPEITGTELRVYRGGSWYSTKRYCRISNRNKNSAKLRNYCLGFRLAEDIIE